jgi:hypothetical protein
VKLIGENKVDIIVPILLHPDKCTSIPEFFRIVGIINENLFFTFSSQSKTTWKVSSLKNVEEKYKRGAYLKKGHEVSH